VFPGDPIDGFPAVVVRSWDELVRPRHELKYASFLMALLAESDFSNTTIRRFDIQRLIARGGMGEVYLARDAVLGRDLALKVLRQDVTWDANRLERFVQEARAASALNHPHLIAIYDIGESAPKRNGVAQGPPVLYIAMELVAGETLRTAIDVKRLDIKRALEYLVQVVDALAAAHSAGVIHRDLKPENLMIADGGYAKVLDFGVAKLRADMAPPGADSDSAPSAGVIGTVGYMSPEQVQGKPLDPRTDIFSFGCVLYEVITGRRAFQGTTSFETLKRILSEEPEPIVEPLVQVKLQPVIRRCLAKNPDDRYQSMRELSHDLRGLLRHLEAATHREAAARVPWRRVLAGAAGIVALVIAVWWTTESGFLGRAPASVALERLTLSGTAIDAATSRDGRYLAWVESLGGMQALRVRQLGEDRSIELVPPAPVGYWGIAFAHDGSRVFYATKSPLQPAGRLFVVSVLGGMPRPLVDGIDSTITLSPDGRKMAFYRASFPERGSTALLVADVDGGTPRTLATTRGQQFFVPAFFAAPSWSPDGARIAASIHDSRTGDAGLVTIDVESGKIDPFPQRFKDATFTAWLPDGSGILFVADQVEELKEIPRKVWLQPYPRGEPRRVTPDLLEYRNISVRGDGSAFVSVGLDAVYSLWRLPLNGQAPQRIASERYDGLLGIAPLKDGRFVMSTGERGNSQLAIVDRTGGSREPLTREGTNMWPAVSPDNKTIVFVSNRDGQTGVWRMNLDGSAPTLLAHLPRPSWLSVTPDGQYVVCASLGDAETATWRVPINGGQATMIAPGIDRPAVSPDGRFLAGINVGSNTGQLSLVTMPLDGSGPPQVLSAIAPATANGLVEWTASGDGILYSTVERANVWLQRLSGGPPIKITNLTDLGIVRGKRSADGASLIVARGVAQTDAYLVSNFQ
jgi:Tol biopolymer transport system component/tRNA A-37 threonylcarbamoyl transferase component Bud32